LTVEISSADQANPMLFFCAVTGSQLTTRKYFSLSGEAEVVVESCFGGACFYILLAGLV
jgi:hypothetical protein